MATMKAYEIGAANGLDTYRLVTRPLPAAGPGEVLVRMRAASLNFRDILLASGQYPFPADVTHLSPLSDGAGEVVAVGPGTTYFAPGDRVAGIFSQSWQGGAQVADAWSTALGGGIDGVLQEYRVFHQDGLVRLPDHLSFEEGATLPCAAVTAWNALYGLKPLQAGQTVLVLGTGGVSIFGLQLAHAAGARVIATSSSDEKLERAKALGADDVINYKVHPDWASEVKRLTGGRGVDHVIEIGGTGTLAQSIGSVNIGGIVSLVGLLAVADAPSMNPMPILTSGAIVRGVLVGSRELFENMNRAIAHHRIKPVIDTVYPFEQATKALQALAQQRHVGKIVIKIGD